MALLLNTGNTVSRSYSIVKPSPTHPVYPTEVGEKTANLFNKDRTTGITDNSYINQSGQIASSNNYYISYPISINAGETYTWSFNSTQGATHSSPTVGFYDSNDNLISVASHDTQVYHFTFTVPNNTSYMKASVYKVSGRFEPMLLSGSTTIDDRIPIPYIPYGYKIPISFGQGTYTSYLAEPIRALSTADEMASTGTTTRNIKKYVITGAESTIAIYTNSAGKIGFSYERLDMVSNSRTDGVCTHFAPIQSILWTTTNSVCFGANNKTCYFIFSDDIATLYNLTDITSIKQWLADQYSAGTPVTIYYPLATPTTETFTAPSIPTSGSPQSFDVDTTLKPSEVSLTYHGWHEHSDEKYVGGGKLI